MENTDGEGPKVRLSDPLAGNGFGGPTLAARAFGLSSGITAVGGVTFLPLSWFLKLLFPALFLSSLPRRAIGFSFPRGVEGTALGSTLIVGGAVVAYLLSTDFGLPTAIVMVWLLGGTGALILFNSTIRGVAFVKQMCSTCRLRTIIEEHELMHLNGVASEEAVWREARKRYSYEGLSLGTDPKIHSFCPIAKRLKDTP